MLQHDIVVLQSFKDAGGISKNPGSMYQVGINADPSSVLDWDKPLSEQPQAFQDLVAKTQTERTTGAKYRPLQLEDIKADSQGNPVAPH